MGNKSTGGAEKMVAVRFGVPIKEWLRDRAHADRTSIGELVRVAVVAHYGSEPGFPPEEARLSQQ